jgi:phosphoserine phosphatase RsbU/P
METARAEIVLMQPNLPPQRKLLETDCVTLGRASDCTVPIRDRFLSRRHAELSLVGGTWLVNDAGSANGTFLNGSRIVGATPLRPGDRITLGDTEIVFSPAELSTDPGRLKVDQRTHQATISIPVQSLADIDTQRRSSAERLQVVNALALELIEDRPMEQLFEFILDRVMNLLDPSRAAIALIADDRLSFSSVRLRRRSAADATELTISRTLLKEVIDEKRVLSFVDVSEDERLGRAMSIINQSIRSAICAPLIVGEAVLGVLYADYVLTEASITEEEVRLMGQIARFAAVKLETTRLREEAYAKHRMEEDLKTAYTIQSRLLPSAPPAIPGYTFAAMSHPCRTVSGDYYDYVIRDGRLWFAIADVSGKGITAALVMASFATAFNIFSQRVESPAELLAAINATLAPKTSPTKFVTAVIGVLDAESGRVQFTNAGHVPPVLVTRDGVSSLRSTDLVVGLFGNAIYRTQELTLEPGDALLLVTDGVTEAEDAQEQELGTAAVESLAATLHGQPAALVARSVEDAVVSHAAGTPAGDDVTIVAMARNREQPPE